MRFPKLSIYLNDWPAALVNATAFLAFALAMSVPSGYSVGAALLLLLGLYSWPAVLTGRVRWSGPMACWAVVVLVMGAAWAMHITDPSGRLVMTTLGLDRVSKYVLVFLALPCLLARRPASAALMWGAIVGAVGAGATALWQVLVLHQIRAEGYTNSIQFGNLSLLLAVWCLVCARCSSPSKWRLPLWFGFAGGLIASVASGTRGGWITLPFLVFVVLWLGFPRDVPQRRGRIFIIAGLVAVLCLSLIAVPTVRARIEGAANQYTEWADGHTATSVGLRLDLWRFALREARVNPLLGVGQDGYMSDLRQAVAHGTMPKMVLGLNHSHNELLDMLAKRGLIGVLALLLFYGLPGLLFLRRLRRNGGVRGQRDDATRAAALCGLVTVLGFVGFGTTQVMFAHNNGNLMYLLGVSLWLAICSRRTPGIRASNQA